MSRNKKIFSAKPAILLAAAAGLLLFATVGSTRAALTYYSENYAAEVTVSNIGVTLTENGTAVGYRDYTHKNGRWNESEGTLLSGLLADGEKFVPGKEYPERLAVTNSGTIDTYIRVIVKKSWIDQEGKETTLSPELIDLNFTGNGWVIDEASSTRERTVLYYTKSIASGESTPDFTDTLRIDPSIAGKVTETVTEENGYQTITTVYAYDGYQFQLEAEADAVQTHNAADAIKSAWGADVVISKDGSLSLK